MMVDKDAGTVERIQRIKAQSIEKLLHKQNAGNTTLCMPLDGNYLSIPKAARRTTSQPLLSARTVHVKGLKRPAPPLQANAVVLVNKLHTAHAHADMPLLH
jgi:hypothetical protein